MTPSERWTRQAKRAALEPHYPAHVRACANNDLPAPPWFLRTWARDNPEVQRRQIYTCNSYRCPSEQCQRHAAHTDFARIKAGLETPGLAPEGWVFFVLTLDQRNTFGTVKKPYLNEQEAFKRLSANTRFFLRRLRAEQRRRDWRKLGNEWVGTIEVQRNGWPHLNLIVYAPELARELREGGHAPRIAANRGILAADSWLLAHIVQTNWGTVSTAEAANNHEALAGYVVKLAGDFARTAGEVAKITQSPTNAKMKLRRIRAGRGFLPAQGAQARALTGADRTGAMWKRENHFGTWLAVPMLEPDQVKPKGETDEERGRNAELYARGMRAAYMSEREELARELELLKQCTEKKSYSSHLAWQELTKHWRLGTMFHMQQPTTKESETNGEITERSDDGEIVCSVDFCAQRRTRVPDDGIPWAKKRGGDFGPSGLLSGPVRAGRRLHGDGERGASGAGPERPGGSRALEFSFWRAFRAE